MPPPSRGTARISPLEAKVPWSPPCSSFPGMGDWVMHRREPPMMWVGEEGDGAAERVPPPRGGDLRTGKPCSPLLPPQDKEQNTQDSASALKDPSFPKNLLQTPDSQACSPSSKGTLRTTEREATAWLASFRARCTQAAAHIWLHSWLQPSPAGPLGSPTGPGCRIQ